MFMSRKKILLTVAAAGVCVKLVEFLVWQASVFRYFNFVPGLDMATLLRFGEWGTPGNDFFLTPHRALTAAWWKLNGQVHFVPGIVAVQALFGVLGAVLCADLALKLCRRDKVAAFCSGGLYLLYGPFFIYEFCVLQEAVALNLILLAFHAAVSARRSRGFLWAGVALGLCVVGRPTALLFVPVMLGFMAHREFRTRRSVRREAAKKLGLALGGAFAVLCLVSVANRSFGGNWNCFYNVLPYSLEFNAGAPEGAAAPGNPYLRMAFNAVSRAPQMFLPTELPENLNYCFLCKEIPLLNALPGPGLLLPFALGGIVLMLTKLRRAEALTLLPILTLVLPLCVRDPIGRYRLTLIPYFILCAGYLLHTAKSRPRSQKLPAALAAATFGIALTLPGYRRDLLRSDDYMAYALALEHPNGGKPTEKSIGMLAEGWEKSGFKNDRLGMNLYVRLIKSGNYAEAWQVLQLGIQRSPENGVYQKEAARLRQALEALRPREKRRGKPAPAPDGSGASGTAPRPPAAPSRK